MQDTASLTLSLDGFEGPLDVLLQLAQSQKLNIRQISILSLAEQYLDFIEHAKQLRLELAADYLVMAAWLAYLKSRLLLPVVESEAENEETPEQMAARLAWQLERLQRMRDLGDQLMVLPHLGVHRFARGFSEAQSPIVQREWHTNLSDMLRAYIGLQSPKEYRPSERVDLRDIYSMDQALVRLRGIVGTTSDWARLESFLPEGWRASPKKRRSATAATFAAFLEMVRDGQIELRQSGAFEPISVRRRSEE